MDNLVNFGEFSSGLKEKELPGPKTYYSGLAKSTKQKRAAQIKKQTDMEDDDPKAYKPLPGDSKKTKTSEYTKKFKQMFGEISEEDEGYMYIPKLKQLIMYAQELLDKVRPDADLPAWIQDKITIAHHNLEASSLNFYEEDRDDEDDDDDDDHDDDHHSNDDLDLPTKEPEITGTETLLLDEGKIGNPAVEKGLQNKVKLAKEKGLEGVTIGILREVMKRGMAAWKTGHRPGAGQEQWGYARVNSFLTGGPTQKGADKDLAKRAGLI